MKELNLQGKSEDYWKTTFNPKRRKESYFDFYFKDEIRKKSLNFRINILLNLNKDVNSFLDVGCGYGAFLYEMYLRNSNLQLGGIDISREAIEFCRGKNPNVCFVNDTFSNINKHFKEKSYDVVYTSGVMIHQAPECLDILIDNIIKIGKKYIVHFEDIGNNELISGEKIYNPEWRNSKQFLWRNDLVSIYKNRGYSFCFGNVPLELQVMGLTNYIIVDLLKDPQKKSKGKGRNRK